MKTNNEVRRFILLHLEPFLTFLSSDEYFFTGNYRKLKEALKQKVLSSYKGENEDYIEFVLNKNVTSFEVNKKIFSQQYLERVTSSKANFYKIYTRLAKYSYFQIFNYLINNNQIKNYELYKLTGLYIEPLQILFSYLISKGINFNHRDFKESIFYNLDLLKNKRLTDVHVHVETSYLFRDLIEFLIRHFEVFYKELNKEDKNLLKDLNIIILTYKALEYSLTERERNILRNLIYNNVSFLIPKTPVFKKFNYKSFIKNALIKLLHSSNGYDNYTIEAILSIQKLNRIMNSLTFKGEYKGLKHMAEYFRAKAKKAFQKGRKNVNEDKIFIEPLQGFKEISHIEIRFSPEIDQIKYWKSWIDNYNLKNVKFILHYKKFKNIEEFYQFYYPLCRGGKDNIINHHFIKETQDLMKFLLKNSDIANLIVGFDAAAIEYWTPPWIYRDLFNIWKNFFKICFGKNIGITFHAGEDFIDAATGLRYIYEAVKFLNTNRIGHGLSLIIDFSRYHMKYQIITYDLFHYFLHLLWLYYLVLEYPNRFVSFKPYVEKAFYQMLDYIQHINGLVKGNLNKNTETIVSSFISDYLQNPVYAKQFYEYLGFSKDFYKIAITQRNIFSNFLFNSIKENYKDLNFAKISFRFLKELVRLIKIYKRVENFTVNPLLPSHIMDFKAQIIFIQEIAKFIQNLINKNNVILEICPSSNIILYNIRSFKDHPIFSGNLGDVKFSINTDNPLLLNTNVVLEHLLMYEAANENQIKGLCQDINDYIFS